MLRGFVSVFGSMKGKSGNLIMPSSEVYVPGFVRFLQELEHCHLDWRRNYIEFYIYIWTHLDKFEHIGTLLDPFDPFGAI